MFRPKRPDTKVGSIEQRYNINLNARADMLLRNLLDGRGFDSQNKLLKAYRGKLTDPAHTHKLFLSFHAEDLAQVRGMRLMAKNKKVDFDFYDGSVREPINSEKSAYLRKVIREKIEKTDVLVCLIGNGTAWRDWVDWEIQVAYEMRKGVCGIRLKGSRGHTPPSLREHGSSVAPWDLQKMVAVIEQAAARRS